MIDRPILTVQQHVLRHQRRHFPHASGEFSWLLSGITLATKMIEAKVRRAGLSDVLGMAGTNNIQGESQQKLDVYANHALMHCLAVRDNVAVLASEEDDQPITITHNSPRAKYVIVFDPLDGSSNIDVNISVGTIFSILRRPEHATADDADACVLQPGYQQIAAGYVVFGSSTVLVYTVGHGVYGFTLDPSIGAYVLSHPHIRMPHQGKYYSVNEAYRDSFPVHYQRYLDQLRSGTMGSYASRYVGSLVADFHRTLIKGGIFLYPPTLQHPSGKLRLLYEANPIAFLAEQAGGFATNGVERMLNVQPKSLHERTPLIVGGKHEMEAFIACCPEHQA